MNFFSTPYGILILVNIIVYAIPFLLGINPNNFLSLGAKDNFAIQNGEWYRLITAMFLHSGVFHLLVNMYSMMNIGPAVLSIFRTNQTPLNQNSVASFLLVYFVSGLVASVISYLVNPNPSVGASGAVFGLIGCLLAFAFLSGNTSLLTNIFSIIAINVVIGFTAPNIDNSAHFGGLIGGFVTSFILLAK